MRMDCGSVIMHNVEDADLIISESADGRGLKIRAATYLWSPMQSFNRGTVVQRINESGKKILLHP